MDHLDNGLKQSIISAIAYMKRNKYPVCELYLNEERELIIKAQTVEQLLILEAWLSDSANIAARYGMTKRQAQKYLKALPTNEVAYILYGRTKKRVCVRSREFFRAKRGRRWKRGQILSDYRNDK